MGVFKCPLCFITLFKKKDTGEGILHCAECGNGWYILLTSREKK